MKVNVHTINLTQLNFEIDCYIAFTNHTEVYLSMNSNTITELSRQLLGVNSIQYRDYDGEKIAKYHGYPICCNESLEDGEVEIR